MKNNSDNGIDMRLLEDRRPTCRLDVVLWFSKVLNEDWRDRALFNEGLYVQQRSRAETWCDFSFYGCVLIAQCNLLLLLLRRQRSHKRSQLTHSLRFNRLQRSDNLPCSAVHLHKYSSVLHFDASLCGFFYFLFFCSAIQDDSHTEVPAQTALKKKKKKEIKISLALGAVLHR